MDHGPLSNVYSSRAYSDPQDQERVESVVQIVRLLQAVGPRRWPARVPWPLHTALVETAEALRLVIVDGKPVTLSAEPSPDLGWRVQGVDAAILELERSGVICLEADAFCECFVVDERELEAISRDFTLLEATQAASIYRAGERWRALASTSLKNLRMAAPSSGETVPSEMPILRLVAEPARR